MTAIRTTSPKLKAQKPGALKPPEPEADLRYIIATRRPSHVAEVWMRIPSGIKLQSWEFGGKIEPLQPTKVVGSPTLGEKSGSLCTSRQRCSVVEAVDLAWGGGGGWLCGRMIPGSVQGMRGGVQAEPMGDLGLESAGCSFPALPKPEPLLR